MPVGDESVDRVLFTGSEQEVNRNTEDAPQEPEWRSGSFSKANLVPLGCAHDKL